MAKENLRDYHQLTNEGQRKHGLASGVEFSVPSDVEGLPGLTVCAGYESQGKSGLLLTETLSCLSVEKRTPGPKESEVYAGGYVVRYDHPDGQHVDIALIVAKKGLTIPLYWRDKDDSTYLEPEIPGDLLAAYDVNGERGDNVIYVNGYLPFGLLKERFWTNPDYYPNVNNVLLQGVSTSKTDIPPRRRSTVSLHTVRYAQNVGVRLAISDWPDYWRHARWDISFPSATATAQCAQYGQDRQIEIAGRNGPRHDRNRYDATVSYAPPAPDFMLRAV